MERTLTDPFGFFNIHCCKTSKIEGGPLGEIFFEKKSHNAKKTEKGDFLDFSTSKYFAKHKNKTGTSKVGAISNAQKAQNIFFGKKLEIFEKIFRKMSHSAEKCKEGTLFDFQTCILLQNNKKLKGGTLWGH